MRSPGLGRFAFFQAGGEALVQTHALAPAHGLVGKDASDLRYYRSPVSELLAAEDLQKGAREEGLLFTAITLHNIPEGMAVGLAFALAGEGESLAAALTLALGIGVQNFPEGAAVSLPLRSRGMGRGRAFLWGAASGAVEPVFGLLAVFAASLARPAMPWLLSLSAGAMLYVTARELCPAAEGRAGALGFVGGFALMTALDVALG